LARKGHLVRSFLSGEALLEALDYEIPDVLFLDLKMPEMDGIETLRRVRQSIPTTLVVMLTAYGSVEDAVEAMRVGAYDFLIKSVDCSTVEPTLNRALNFLELRRRIAYTASEKQRQYSWDHVIATSPLMTQVVEKLKFLSVEETLFVYLQGEVGTGKEFLARVLHYNSPKHLGPFVTVSCTEQRRSLIEPQLFGYERGAFSGANQAMPGAFEYSEGGTLFLDEIECLPFPVQGSLAEAIRTRSFCRMGGFDRFPVNNRLVVTSAIQLDLPGQQKKIHPELRALLCKNQIIVPSLTERKEDIIPLAMKTIRSYGEEIGRPKLDIDSSVPVLLENYRFPGNIRELEALIKRAVLCAQGPVLTSLDFYSQSTDHLEQEPSHNTVRIQFQLGEHSLTEIHGLIIREILRLAKQDKDLAARYLYVSLETLEEQIRGLGEMPLATKSSLEV
ncbi:MAG: sigma-54 dependent transcriptional regulator, partial [Nitrospirales bacterium]|nr:sigma-54 dependent transcriptional regulator [Nitrospirales bacterium]